MNTRWVVVVVIVVVGWGLLEVMLHQLKIGEYARSPQHFELFEGTTTLVAGGKASLSFVEAPFLRSARFWVKCKDTHEKLQLRPGQQSDVICGVRFLFERFVPGGKVAVTVTWGDDDQPEPSPGPESPSGPPTPTPTEPQGAPTSHD